MSLESQAGGEDRLNGLIALFNEHNADARWQEECREKSSSAIIAANSVIVGIIAAFDLQFPFIIFCVIQFILAETGQKFILKYHALAERRHAYASELQDMIYATAGLNALGVEQAIAEARAEQFNRLNKKTKLAGKLVKLDKATSIHELWYALHNGFKAMSVLLAAVIVARDLQEGKESSLLALWHAAAPYLHWPT